MKPSSYTLSEGATAAEHLEYQSKLIEPETRTHLQRAGLDECKQVLEIGCGTGDVTFLIASMIGPRGIIVAIDISQAQLNILNTRAKDKGYQNIITICMDICNMSDEFLTQYASQFDFICSRLIFMHVPKPIEVIKKISSVLKVEGFFTSQESILDTSYSKQKNTVFHEINELIIGLGKNKGVDYNIGSSLKDIFIECGFVVTNSRVFQKRISMPDAKKLTRFILNQMEPHLIEKDSNMHSKLTELYDLLNQVPDDDIFYFPEQAQLIAYRP